MCCRHHSCAFQVLFFATQVFLLLRDPSILFAAVVVLSSMCVVCTKLDFSWQNIWNDKKKLNWQTYVFKWNASDSHYMCDYDWTLFTLTQTVQTYTCPVIFCWCKFQRCELSSVRYRRVNHEQQNISWTLKIETRPVRRRKLRVNVSTYSYLVLAVLPANAKINRRQKNESKKQRRKRKIERRKNYYCLRRDWVAVR